ncbi:MAG: hypothetical protein V1770_04240 [bacterium]
MPIENKPQSAFDKLDTSKIGSGHRFTEGTWDRGIGQGINKDAGLKGQLRNLQIAGRHGITKNLSTKNIKQIYGLIADRIKKKPASGVFLNMRDNLAIMKESRKMVKQKDSDFTWEDRKDLKKVVDTLRAKSRESILRRDDDERGISPSLSSSPIPSSPTPPAPSLPPRVNLPPLPSNLNNFGGGMRPKI